jgi:hypothetical protein
MEPCLKTEGCFTTQEKFYLMLFLSLLYMLWTLNDPVKPVIQEKKEEFYNLI